MTTYTREQMEQMSDGELEEIVPKVMGWREEEHPGVNGIGQWHAEYEYGVYHKPDGTMVEVLGYEPASEIEEALELQSEAIKQNPYEYIMQLCAILLNKEYTKSHLYHFNDIIQMLQATPRQITIAAILTLQGEGKSE